MKIRNRASSALAAALLMTGLAPVLAPSASAAEPASNNISPSHVASTDSRRTEVSTDVTNTHAPLGTTDRDAEGNTRRAAHRAYARYDLASVGSGTDLHSFTLSLQYTATNCKAVDVTVSAVPAPSAPITWESAPQPSSVIHRVMGDGQCGAGGVLVDATAAARAALARGGETLYLEFRVTGAKELSPTFGLYLSRPDAWAEFTGSPFVQAGSQTADYRPCVGAEDTWLGAQPRLTARVGGSDMHKTAEFRISPAGATGEALTRAVDVWGTELRTVTFPWSSDDVLPEGDYLWQVRAFTESETSDWTTACTFHLDATAPSAAPVVTVLNADDVVAGRPVRLRVESGGVADARCYQLADSEDFMLPRNGGDPCSVNFAATPPLLGGVATAEFPTDYPWPLTIHVRSVDRAGNVSPISKVSVYVRNSAPAIDPMEPTGPAGVPITITATADAALWPVKEFRVTIGSAPEQVMAATDNTVSFPVAPVAGEYTWVYIRSVSVDGTVSNAGGVNVIPSDF